jgi:hypothetical protein
MEVIISSMRFKIKILHWPDAGHHALVIIWGVVDHRGLMQILDELARATAPLPGCKILIDFENAEVEFRHAGAHFLADGLTPRCLTEDKIAVVSGCKKEDRPELIWLRRCLAARGFNAAIFKHPRDASAWLSSRVLPRPQH